MTFMKVRKRTNSFNEATKHLFPRHACNNINKNGNSPVVVTFPLNINLYRDKHCPAAPGDRIRPYRSRPAAGYPRGTGASRLKCRKTFAEGALKRRDACFCVPPR